MLELINSTRTVAASHVDCVLSVVNKGFTFFFSPSFFNLGNNLMGGCFKTVVTHSKAANTEELHTIFKEE